MLVCIYLFINHKTKAIFSFGFIFLKVYDLEMYFNLKIKISNQKSDWIFFYRNKIISLI